jgi:hypothetical protein
VDFHPASTHIHTQFVFFQTVFFFLTEIFRRVDLFSARILKTNGLFFYAHASRLVNLAGGIALQNKSCPVLFFCFPIFPRWLAEPGALSWEPFVFQRVAGFLFAFETSPHLICMA